jgi:hypothetical protein
LGPSVPICYELDDTNHPLHYAPMYREAAIANAVGSGDVPVRGRRDVASYAGDDDFIILSRGSAFERIETLMTMDAKISVYADTVAVKLPPPRGAGGATWVGGMPQVAFTPWPWPRLVKYVDVEADRRAVEEWIRENALPAGWISAAEGSEKVRFPAGRKPKADWDALEAALKLRIDDIGYPTPDHADKNWRRREDVIRWAQDLLEDRKEPVARTTVAGQIDGMLARLKPGEHQTEI